MNYVLCTELEFHFDVNKSSILNLQRKMRDPNLVPLDFLSYIHHRTLKFCGDIYLKLTIHNRDGRLVTPFLSKLIVPEVVLFEVFDILSKNLIVYC